MKPGIYILMAIALSVIGCSRNEIVIAEADLPDDVFYYNNEIKPYCGRCLIYYSGTDVVKEVLNFSKGILNGERLSFYPNGMKKREGQFHNGELHGVWKGWDENGVKLFEVSFKCDSLNGSSIIWHSNGQLKEKGDYIANRKDGDWIYYDTSGTSILKN